MVREKEIKKQSFETVGIVNFITIRNRVFIYFIIN